MISVRSPLRISFGGGGTDLPAYYERFGGMVVSAAISPACHVTLTPYAGAGIELRSRDFDVSVPVPSQRQVVIREPLSLPRAVLSWFAEPGEDRSRQRQWLPDHDLRPGRHGDADAEVAGLKHDACAAVRRQ